MPVTSPPCTVNTGPSGLPCSAHHHEFWGIAFANNDVTGSSVAFLTLQNKPSEVFVRQVFEDLNLSQLRDEFAGRRLGGAIGHARPALLNCGLIVPWSDIDA
jgi:hypothetical protein